MSKEFSIPEIDIWMDEAQYMRASDLIDSAASLAGDGQGGELDANPEYMRGMCELTCRFMGWEDGYADQVSDAIRAYAKDNHGGKK